MKCLHFMHDSVFTKKILNEIQEIFPIETHTIFVITNEEELKYIRPEVIRFKIRCVKVPRGLKKCFAIQNEMLKKAISQYDRVYVHYLDNWAVTWVTEYVQSRQTVYWIVWGGDLYCEKGNALYEKETYQLVKMDSLWQSLKNDFFFKRKRIKFMNRMNFICTNYQGDYSFFKECYPKAPAQHLRFIFPQPIDIDKMPDSIFRTTGSETRILVGNSGSAENNHIEVFLMLKNLKGEFKVFCPLSYGDSQYASKIIEIGKEILGEHFIPVIDFMELDIYYEFLNSIDVAIMNHKRQQAGGNILALLYLGKTIYMNPTSIYEDILLGNGHVLLEEELNSIMNCNDFITLREEQIEDNRKYVKRCIDKNNRVESYKVVLVKRTFNPWEAS